MFILQNMIILNNKHTLITKIYQNTFNLQLRLDIWESNLLLFQWITLLTEYKIESYQKKRFPSKFPKRQKLLQIPKIKTMWEDTNLFLSKYKILTM